LSRPVTVALELTPTPHQVVPAVTPMGADEAFGYVVPVVRGRMTGRVTVGGKTYTLDGTGYHDHNWGHFRDAVWDWGVIHADEVSVLYGRFARSMTELLKQPVLFAIFDDTGPRPFFLTHDYQVKWTGVPPRVPITQVEGDPDRRPLSLVPAGIDLAGATGDDQLTIKIVVARRFVTETGEGEEPLFRADADKQSFFYQLEGTATLRGRVDGVSIDTKGHAYSETFFVR
jgi:hypothetical protein